MSAAGRRLAYAEAAAWFVDVVDGVGAGRWDDAALGVWTVRDLVGHTSRSLLTVEAYLRPGEDPSDPVDLATPVAYLRATSAAAAGDAVAQRGRDAGAALGDDPAAAVRALTARVLALVGAAADDAVVATPFGSMHLVDHLPTRTVELAVHTCDLAAALGVEAAVPERVASEAMAVAGGAAAATGRAAHLLLASAGRRGLPEGFTVL